VPSYKHGRRHEAAVEPRFRLIAATSDEIGSLSLLRCEGATLSAPILATSASPTGHERSRLREACCATVEATRERLSPPLERFTKNHEPDDLQEEPADVTAQRLASNPGSGTDNAL
jgi:hypothetical protein